MKQYFYRIIAIILTITSVENIRATESVNYESYKLPKQYEYLIPILTKMENSLPYIDLMYKRDKKGIILLPKKEEENNRSFENLGFKDTMIYNPIFLPPVFKGIGTDNILIKDNDSYNIYYSTLLDPRLSLSKNVEDISFVENTRLNFLIKSPEIAKYTIFEFDDTEGHEEVASKKIKSLQNVNISNSRAKLDKESLNYLKPKRVYWTKNGSHNLQFSQVYFSQNWHKGGVSNLNINNYHVLNLNYKKDRTRFNNSIEWRLTFYDAPDDSLRNVNIGTDMLKYYGDFGVDVIKKSWSFSMNTEIRTQIFNNYKPNSSDLTSALLAPLYVNWGIGMKYDFDNKDKSKKLDKARIKLAIALSPLSINHKYVNNESVDKKRFGIPEDKKRLTDLGSTITATMLYDIKYLLTWNSRIKYFSNFSKTEIEFENTLNFEISRYFSTRLYVNLRFDDGVQRDPRFNYLQINETLSFGVNYRW